MQTLILATEGMAAYGLQTFDVQRRVNHFPTRSAVMGLLGAAKGIQRSQHKQLFALSQELKIAVLVRQQGQKIVDYHTVQIDLRYSTYEILNCTVVHTVHNMMM